MEDQFILSVPPSVAERIDHLLTVKASSSEDKSLDLSFSDDDVSPSSNHCSKSSAKAFEEEKRRRPVKQEPKRDPIGGRGALGDSNGNNQ